MKSLSAVVQDTLRALKRSRRVVLKLMAYEAIRILSLRQFLDETAELDE